MTRAHFNSYAPEGRKGWDTDYIPRGNLLSKGQETALAEKGVTP